MSVINLLLVDDEEMFLSTTQMLLEKHGMKAFTSTNGYDALDLLTKQRIDVVVLDVKMPGISGIDVLRKIRQEHPGVEVILLTGHASVETAVEGLKIGAFDYLVKPALISEIITKTEEAFAKKRAKEERASRSRIDRIMSHPMAVYEEDKD